MRALLLAWRALAEARTHSSSRASVFWRALACFSSIFQAFLLLLQPGRVVALERQTLAIFEFENPLGRVVEKVAIVRHGDDRAFVFVQVAFEPGDAFGVEMVRRLVEQQAGRAARAESCTARRGVFRRRRVFVTSASPGGRFIASMAISIWRSSSQALTCSILSCTAAWRLSNFSISSGSVTSPSFSESCSYSVSSARVSATASSTLPRTSFFGIEMRLLLEQADGKAFAQAGLAVEVLVDPGHDPQQRALARAVAAQHADLGAGIKREPDIFEDFALADLLGHARHLVDVFLGHAVRFGVES